MTYLSYVPDPPRDVLAPATTHDIALAVAIVVAGLFLIYALYDFIRHRTPALLMCAVGGLLAALTEPFYGVLGLLNYREGNIMTFVMFNFRGDPTWSTLLYPAFAGGSAYLFFQLFKSGSSKKEFWRAVAVVFGANLIIEIPLTALKLYDYYGPQPFQFYDGGFPLWWLFTNLGGIASGALLVVAERRFGTRGTLLAVPLIPSAFVAWEVWTGWPTFAALNLGGSVLWTTVAAVITAALSISTAWMVAEFMLPKPHVTGEIASEPSRAEAH
ncbi:hypothetical protein ACFTWF_36575 [Rhodococcus sp. NPDC056960]|uniref:hypothetical protein n=1 Tax=Rhodococcus sp. NPDC056960 TaxID=3345982 RepID=UPI0036369480